MKNKCKIDFDKKILELTFNGENHAIDLSEGDSFDNWNAIQTADKKIYDINVYFSDDETDDITVVLYEIISKESSENYTNPILVNITETVGEVGNYCNREGLDPFEVTGESFYDCF